MNELARFADIDVPQHPVLARWVEPTILADGALQLRSSEYFYNLRHSIFADAFFKVAPLLDGSNELSRVLEAGTSDDVLPTTVLYLLKSLRGLGLLFEANNQHEQTSHELTHFFSQFSTTPDDLTSRLMVSKVRVFGSTKTGNDLAQLLNGMGIKTTYDDRPVMASNAKEDASLLVGCFASPNRDELEHLNTYALMQDAICLYGVHMGITTFIGPTVIPSETACFNCLDRRLAATAQNGDYGGPGLVSLDENAFGSYEPLTRAFVSNLAAEAVRLVSGFAPPATLGQFTEYRADTPATQMHRVLRVPGCSACASSSRSAE